MDGTAAIQSNLEALKRILAGLVSMAGLGCLSSPLAGEDGSARRGKAELLAEPGEGSGSRFTLPRHLRLAILRLLRPAEAAARRLIIASARGLIVTLPTLRKSAPKPETMAQLRRFGIAVVLSPADIAAAAKRATRPHPEAPASGGPRRTTFPLFDPPRRFRILPGGRIVPAHAAPRVLLPGLVQPYSLPPPPSLDDPIDATRLALRLAALAAALDDLPGQARRFARWQARQQARSESPSPLWGGVRGGGTPGGTSATATTPRPRRISPLRPGRPPGGRLSRFDPSANRDAAGAQTRNARSNIREIDEILAHAHALALHALHPDTS